MSSTQLDFFKDEEKYEIEILRTTLDKVRKGTYAKINSLNKECVDLKERLQILEKYICNL